MREYLPELTKRTKWHAETVPIKSGDLVLVCDDQLPYNLWRRGRVEKLFAGPDGRIRNVIVKTATGELRRPVSKLAVLDVAERDPSEQEAVAVPNEVAQDVEMR